MCQRYWARSTRTRSRPEPSEWLTHPQGGATRNSASCRTFLAAEVAVELAEQGIAVFLGPVGEVGEERFDLFARGFAEALGPTEIDRVGLDQVGIELMLADQLAEAVADFGTAVVSVFSIDRLGRELLRLSGGRSRCGKRPDLLDRADADAVGLAQGPVYRPVSATRISAPWTRGETLEGSASP